MVILNDINKTTECRCQSHHSSSQRQWNQPKHDTQLYGHIKKAVVVFFKEFQWDQRPQPLQNYLIHHSTKISQ